MPEDNIEGANSPTTPTPQGQDALKKLKGLFGKFGGAGGGSGITAILGKKQMIIPLSLILVVLFCMIFFFISAIAVYASRLGAVPGYAGGVGGGLLTYPPGVSPESVAPCLDDWIKKTRSESPLNGKGLAFATAGQKYNINPALMIAITALETELGTTGTRTKEHNDPFSMMTRHFESLDEAIDLSTEWMRKGYLDEGLDTIPQIGAKYAPIGASNDPKGTNKEWVPSVTKFFNLITSSCPTLSSFNNYAIVGGGSGNALAVATGEINNDDYKRYNGHYRAWCADFVTWVYKQAGFNVPQIAAPKGVRDYFRKNMVWVDNPSASQIQPGDIVYFDNNPGSNSGTHIGIVESVSGNTVNTIEGNTGRARFGKSRVLRQTRNISDTEPRIAGIGRGK